MRLILSCQKDFTMTSRLRNQESNLNGPDLSDADAKLLALLNAAADAMIIINHKGEIELFNHAAETVFGYSQSQVMGRNVKILMPTPFKEQHDQYLNNYQTTGTAKIIGTGRQVKARKASGEIFPIYLSVGQVKSAGPTKFVGIIRDISEQEKNRKEAEESRERLSQVTRLQTMGEMAAGIAHEINQPLSAISMYAEACKRLLNNPGTGHEQLENTLEKIAGQAHRASEVISHLREFVKKRHAQFESVELNRLIEETIRLAMLDTRILELELSVRLYSDEIFIAADPIQIQQVLLNLIRNAIDAMEDMPGAALTVTSDLVDSNHAEVSVADTGRGIDKEHQASIFTPFHTTKASGMGMGLAVSQTIIHAHGGTLTFAARPTGGSVFSFRLPATPDSDMKEED